jgi:hypothetical protein
MAITFIAHRGNLNGPNPSEENQFDYLYEAWVSGYNVECDVIGYKHQLYFGHDEPQQLADERFLCYPEVWVHAKNLEAVNILSKLSCHWFWHQEDWMTLTSQGKAWCYPGVYIDSYSAVFLDLEPQRLDPLTLNKYLKCDKVCGDYKYPWVEK